MRDPSKRLQAIGDARLELDEAFGEPEPSPSMATGPVRAVPPSWRRFLPWSVAVAALALGWFAGRQVLSEERRPRPFLQTPASESPAVFSPDGRWVTYTSDESGTWQCYVTAFPQGGRKWQISEENGSYPNWGPDGKTITFIRNDGTLVAVDVDVSGDTFRMTRSRVLGRVGVPGGEGEDHSFTPDGRRWLSIHDPAQEAGVGSLEVILGWKELLKE